jgi:hypothetical protein
MLERAITNFSDGSALAVARRDKKFHQVIERLGILMPAGFEHTIRKKIKIGRKTERHLHIQIFGIREATNWRTAGR